MKSIIIGATGATGKDLVDTLLRDAQYQQVTIFVRRPTGIKHPKLLEIITDFNQLENVKAQVHGDILFSCLGTTLKAAGSKENQRRIDLEIPLKFAQMARQNGISSMVLLSAYGASPKSRLFYSRIKGELEAGIAQLQFNQYVIFKPGLLLRKNTDRWSERIAGSVLKFLNRLGLAQKFRPLPTALLAKKMAKVPHTLPNGTHTITLNKIFDLPD